MQNLKTKFKLSSLVIIVSLSMMTAPAFAHLLVCQCKIEKDNVVCTGGYSDASSVVGTPIQVIDYDEKVLLAGNLDKNSRYVFKAPQGEFYVFLDGGPGHTVEVDRADINGL